MNLSWILLVVAGIFEVVWAVGLKYTDGFRNPLPSVLVVIALAVSTVLLAIATRKIPIGVAYPVWVGIGAAGAVLLGTLLFKEPMSLSKGFFLGLLIVAIIGLKLSEVD